MPEEAKRGMGKAFVPAANCHLQSLRSLNTSLVAQLQKRRPIKTATLDGDATPWSPRITKARCSAISISALTSPTTSGGPSSRWYSCHSEFRDGNVPAGWDIIRVLKEALASLPEGVEQVFMRQDTAAYTTMCYSLFCEREKEHPGIRSHPSLLSPLTLQVVALPERRLPR